MWKGPDCGYDKHIRGHFICIYVGHFFFYCVLEYSMDGFQESALEGLLLIIFTSRFYFLLSMYVNRNFEDCSVLYLMSQVTFVFAPRATMYDRSGI